MKEKKGVLIGRILAVLSNVIVSPPLFKFAQVDCSPKPTSRCPCWRCWSRRCWTAAACPRPPELSAACAAVSAPRSLPNPLFLPIISVCWKTWFCRSVGGKQPRSLRTVSLTPSRSADGMASCDGTIGASALAADRAAWLCRSGQTAAWRRGSPPGFFVVLFRSPSRSHPWASPAFFGNCSVTSMPRFRRNPPGNLGKEVTSFETPSAGGHA